MNMALDIPAIYENGQLRLLEPVDLAEGERVTVKILTINEEDEALRKALGGLVAQWPDTGDDSDAYLEERLKKIAHTLSDEKPISDYVREERDER
jgi:predicted DNA-binding antitoxin AbrB/MazE fold protein